MIENLDENIGRLLAGAGGRGQAENTVVIFTSDNGGLATAEGSPTCNAPLAEGKGWMYEGGTREPLIVRWPGVIAAGQRRATSPVTSPDFYPTLLEAAGPGPDARAALRRRQPACRCLRGRRRAGARGDLLALPALRQPGRHAGLRRCARGDYKLIEFFEDGRLELYNLREDIGEEHDLAEDCPS